ncbi:MAG: DUF512 domain-containing protein [Chloroflexi bacterium]|nr:DUF512 domain-containing protein [Chloroflexota bacterium]
MKPSGGIISGVDPGSPADIAGVRPGDRLLAVNGHKVSDIVDYLYYNADDKIRLTLLRGSRKSAVDISRDEPVPLGIEFEKDLFDGVRRCSQRCVFCFMDQMPKGLRRSLYLKDDDYRLSFLFGNYITLNDLEPHEWKRIIRQRLSPLYISVQAVDPVVREVLFGSKKAWRILPKLSRLAEAGISFHLQIVVCPGINDGDVLKQTIEALAGFYPAAESIAVIPVGLTKHRKGLFPLKPVDAGEAAEILDLVHSYQDRFLDKFGTRLVWAADELYLKAGEPLPGYSSYEEFSQAENGVGLSRWFITGFRRRKRYLPGLIEKKRKVTVVTGELGKKVLGEVEEAFSKIKGLDFRIVAVKNEFLGKSVTVAGLISGRDIIKDLKGSVTRNEIILVPETALREGNLFLDGISIEKLKSRLGCRVKTVDIRPEDLITAVFFDE